VTSVARNITDAPTAQSALHQIYTTLAAAMEIRHGWSLPAHFSSVDAEVDAARAAVAVGELFGVSTLDLVGAKLTECASRLGVGEVPIGAAAPVALAEAEEGRWLRLTRTHARILIPSEAVRSVLAALDSVGDCLHATDISSGLTTLAAIGPRSPDLLARLVRLDLDPRAFADHTVALTGAAGIPLQVLRWDRCPLLTYELTVGRDVAEYFWENLSHASDGLGLQPIGIRALARLEGVSP
jgi:heterotetrameric sarcosine oxidase gamma subunit